MFAVRMKVYLLFARLSSLSRPASLDLEHFTNPSEIRLFTCSSIVGPVKKSQKVVRHFRFKRHFLIGKWVLEANRQRM